MLGAKESEESLDNNDGLQLKVQFKGSEGMQKMKALVKMKEKKMKRDQRKKEVSRTWFTSLYIGCCWAGQSDLVNPMGTTLEPRYNTVPLYISVI